MALFTRQILQEKSSHDVFQRGMAIAQDRDAVELLSMDAQKIVAIVEGSNTYKATLTHKSNDWEGYCSCPAFADYGGWCKHLVAVGLVALENAVTATDTQMISPLRQIQEYLETLHEKALQALLMEQVENDKALLKKLLIKANAAQAKGGKLDLKALRKAVTNTLTIRDYVEYREAYSYAAGVRELLDSLADLLEQGHAEALKDLMELCWDIMEEAMGRIDDSNGETGQFMGRIAELHLAACLQAKPEPVRLAEELFEREIGSDWDIFEGDVYTDYADALGETGRAAYRACVDAAWEKLPALQAGDKQDYGKRWRITCLKKRMVLAEGNLDAIIAVLSKDLSSSYYYLGIAEQCVKHERDDLALDYALQGLQNFESLDDRLVDFVTTLAERQGDPDLALSWHQKAFAKELSYQQFERLRNIARKQNRWEALRDDALQAIEKAVVAQTTAKPQNRWHGADASLLVKVLLLEEHWERAWQTAVKHGCSQDLWLKLAVWRAQDHPAEVVPYYQTWVHAAIEGQGNNGGYETALKHLLTLKPIMERLGQQAAFNAFVADIKTRYKAKRNMMKLLETLSLFKVAA